MKRLKLLFVCLGNICRSPMAEGSLGALLETAGLTAWIESDSAGLHCQFCGLPPDERAQQAARNHHIDISRHRARRVCSQDFEHYDYVVPVDRETQARLLARCPASLHHKVRLLLSFAPETGERDIPDPYYGEQHDFDTAFELIAQGTQGLLRYFQEYQSPVRGGPKP